MRPIDCTKMKVGDKAVTRGGREATLIHVLSLRDRKYVFSIEDEYVCCFFENGNNFGGMIATNDDLFEIVEFHPELTHLRH